MFYIFSGCTIRDYHNIMIASDNKKRKKPMLYEILPFDILDKEKMRHSTV